VKDVRIVLCGLGNVGKAFLELLAERTADIEARYGLRLSLAAAVDIGGAAASDSPGGVPTRELLAHLRSGGRVEDFGKFSRPGLSAMDAINAGADAMVESTPTNLKDGEPARTNIEAALRRGMQVISANKGPIVLFYKPLTDLARKHGGGLHISAATAAALPTLDVARVCLAGARILSAEGILNGTTNYILTRMRNDGATYDTALKEAQKLGIAETDPSKDVGGYDTATKLVIIGNCVFGASLSLKDVPTEGITKVTPEDIARATKDGEVIKLVGSAEVVDGKVRLSVAPKRLKATHPLASVNGSEKAISYMTDTMDRITVSGGKSSPVGAAAALLKDLINAYV
jgi:homoserine dehydrogenase